LSSQARRTLTGLLSTIEVTTSQGIIIGYGHVIEYEGRILGPYLGTLTGNEMPAGWYVMRIDKDPVLIVMNEVIQ
jgi:hypothetical protein